MSRPDDSSPGPGPGRLWSTVVCRRSMSIETINPDDLSDPEGYAPVAIATGTKRVYLTG